MCCSEVAVSGQLLDQAVHLYLDCIQGHLTALHPAGGGDIDNVSELAY